MASITSAITQYPVLEALCPHIHAQDLANLGSTSSIFRGVLKDLPKPLPFEEGKTPNSKIRCTCHSQPHARCGRHGTRLWRNLMRKVQHTCMDSRHINRSLA